jgi:hypothetical protein
LIPCRYHWDQLDAKLIVLDINFLVRVRTYNAGLSFALFFFFLGSASLLKILHYCPISPSIQQPCPAALPGSLARQPCLAALPGSLARQPCPAALPGSLARQLCPAALPGSLARQPCPAALPGRLARQPCPAALPGSLAPAALPRQPCPDSLAPAALPRQPCPGSLAPAALPRQPCPAALPSSLARQPCLAAMPRQPCPAVRPISTGFDARARSLYLWSLRSHRTVLQWQVTKLHARAAVLTGLNLFLVQFHHAFITCHQIACARCCTDRFKLVLVQFHHAFIRQSFRSLLQVFYANAGKD